MIVYFFKKLIKNLRKSLNGGIEISQPVSFYKMDKNGRTYFSNSEFAKSEQCQKMLKHSARLEEECRKNRNKKSKSNNNYDYEEDNRRRRLRSRRSSRR